MSISHLVANDPEIPVSNIIQEVQILFEMGCTYKRAWYARKFAIERDLNPGTVYEFLHHRTSSLPNYVFKFVFWCFSPCIDGFFNSRLVISVDGTHLKGPYKGVLLIASTWDANNHLNPPKVGIGSLKTYENTLSKIATLMWQTETESKQWKFDRVMKEIQERNVNFYIYLMKLDLEKWTLLHDGGHRHDIMITNIS
ncbi:hypothetical protein M9H77_26538 [Catharanthus roseus]|uniref:Uncharacterized protein n=1 Tax=Catharanthus roseus TaxID=4058 RepID=A0ACC0AA31_CATRO|nr:hypothetical protein M9H77_26538 [Catharanthus roseus]